MHESTTKLSSKAIKSTKSTNSMWIPGPSLSKGGAWGQWYTTYSGTSEQGTLWANGIVPCREVVPTYLSEVIL